MSLKHKNIFCAIYFTLAPLPLPANIRLGCKCLKVKNALVYSILKLIMIVEFFIVKLSGFEWKLVH
jgi:hypothetical protein